MTDGNIHVFRLLPMPGFPEGAKITISQDDQTLFLLLPDDSQIIFTADRAVFIRGRDAYMLNQWQQPAEWVTAQPISAPPPSRHPGSIGIDGQRGVPWEPHVA